MIDLVTIRLRNTSEEPQFKCDRGIPEAGIEKGTPVYRGYLNNLVLKQTVTQITIVGSLAKYLHGENCTPLTHKQIIEAIQKLEHESGLDLETAQITRLEVGISLEVQKDTAAYLDLFLNVSKKYKKHVEFSDGEIIESIAFLISGGKKKKRRTVFKIYDKVKEMNASQIDIPIPYRDKNVLRLERTFYSRDLRVVKHGKAFSLYDLKNKACYNQLQKRFYDWYDKIKKKPATINLCDCIEQAVQEQHKKLSKVPVINLISRIHFCEHVKDVKTALARAVILGYITNRIRNDVLKKLHGKDIPASCLLTELNSKIEAICFEKGRS